MNTQEIRSLLLTVNTVRPAISSDAGLDRERGGGQISLKPQWHDLGKGLQTENLSNKEVNFIFKCFNITLKILKFVFKNYINEKYFYF